MSTPSEVNASELMGGQEPAPEARPPDAGRDRRRTSRITGRMSAGHLVSRYGIVGAWALLVAVFWVLRPATFGTAQNFQNIFGSGSQAVLLVLALGLLLSLTVNEFDLSFAGSMAVAIVVLGVLNGQLHVSIWLSVLAALAAGVVIGIVNATLTLAIGVPSIVVTLGTGTLLAALATAIRDVVVTDISPGFVTVVSGTFLGLTHAAYFALALTVVTWYVLTFTPLGRYMFFVGANQNVARLSGLPVSAIRFGSLVATSTFSALAGIILVGSLGSAGPQFATPFLLPAFAAAFLGSTTIRPGRFNAWGAFVAVYFLTTGITGLELMGLSGWIEGVFYGGSLVAASSLSYLSKARVKRAAAPAS